MLTFNFIKSDLTPVYSGFSYKPLNYPIVTGSQIVNADVIVSSQSPASFSVPDNRYQVQCNLEVNNDWYIQTANGNYSVISGSTITASVCIVDFSILENDLTPDSDSLVRIQPINSNVLWVNNGSSSFVMGDTIDNRTDEYGDLTVSLLPQPYSVFIKGRYRDTKFQILPSGSFGYAKDFIVVGSVKAIIPPPQNTQIYTYTNYVLFATASLSSSYAVSASYALKAGSSVTSDTSSFLGFNGNRNIKRTGYVGINVGGLDVDTFLDNFFFPFISSTVSINDGITYYETGSSNTITVNGTIEPNDETMFGTGSVYKDSAIWHNIPTIPPYPYSFNDVGVTTNHTYFTTIQTLDNGNIISSTKTVNYIAPFLFGVSNDSNLSGSTLHSLSIDVSPLGNKAYTITGTATRLRFAYPATYPDLTHILDGNLFQVLTSTTQTIVSMVGLNGFTENYKLYTWNSVADFTGIYTFQF